MLLPGAYLEVFGEALPPHVPIQAVVENMIAYDLFVFEHGYKPGAPQLCDLLFSLFLHGGLLHLFGNMLFLWIYGDNVEHRLGRFPFMLCYLLSGVAATLFFALFTANSKTPLVGASGAISGVLGFYFLWFPRNSVRLFVFLFPIFVNGVTVPARIVLGFYLIVDNLLPFFLSSSEGSGVAHGAHIGGFLAGLGMAAFLNRKEIAARPPEYRAVKQGPATLSEAIEIGDFAVAAPAYFALRPEQTRGVLRPEASLALGNWLAANEHPEVAVTVFRRHLRDYPKGPGAAEAHFGLGQVQLEHLGQVASAYPYFLEVLELDLNPRTARQARAPHSRRCPGFVGRVSSPREGICGT